MTVELDEHGRPEPPLDGDEFETLTGFLDFQRATFAWKCANLTSTQLRQPLPPSSMTLGGLIKHLTYVEDDWFGRWLLDEPRREPWAAVDWVATPDWEWTSAADDDADALTKLWRDVVTRARGNGEAVYRDSGLATPARRAWPDGRSPSLRWIYTHMVEEYSRHNGHADLLREAIDGATGE